MKSWHVNIGNRVKKGEPLAILEVPEAVAEVEQKKAAIDQAKAVRNQAGAAVKVVKAEVQTAEAKLAEARAGLKRVKAEVARWQDEVARIDQHSRERAQTESVLDETRSKLKAAESSQAEVDAQIQFAEAARICGTQAALEKAQADSAAASSQEEVDAQGPVRRGRAY